MSQAQDFAMHLLPEFECHLDPPT